MRSPRDSMQECQVCGLLFGGGDRCPECKSVFGSKVEIDQDDSLPSGPLPGTASLSEILPDVDGLSGPSSQATDTRSNLPFTLGGARASTKVQLLFGTGARSDLSMSTSEEEMTQNEALSNNESSESQVNEMLATEQFPTDESMEFYEITENSMIEPEFEIKADETLHVEHGVGSEIVPEEDAILLTSRPIVNTSVTQTQETDDVVYHDFSDESNFTEVEVDFDKLVDPAEEASAFDPIDGETRLVQMPARAIQLHPPFLEGHEELMISGFELMRDEKWEDAAKIFMTLCEHRPGDAPSINNHGLCLLQSALIEYSSNPNGDPAELTFFHAAILTLRQAAMADRSSAPILVNLATALAAADRHETALPIFEAASSLEENPDSNRMNNQAVTLHAMGRNVEATSMLENAQSHSPEDPIIAENVRVLTISF